MNTPLSEISKNQSAILDIYNHLKRCDQDFVPQLSSYVDIKSYSEKLYNNALRYEYWSKDNLVGLLAVYLNESHSTAFITNLSIEQAFMGSLKAKSLLDFCISELKQKTKIKELVLEVYIINTRAIKFYNKRGFVKFKDLSENRIELIKKINE